MALWTLCVISLIALLSPFASAAPPAVRQGSGNSKEDCSLTSVCFAIDESGSIDNIEFDEELQFVNSIARTVGSRAKSVVYSAVLFSSSARLVEPGTSSLSQFQRTIKNIVRSSGGTDISSGLELCLDQVTGSRSQQKVIVAITDGSSGGDPVAVADSINARPDVSIVTVGIGNGINEAVLRAVAAGPEFFLPTDFGKLPAAVLGVVSNVCEVVEMALEPTAEPSVDPTPEPATPAPATPPATPSQMPVVVPPVRGCQAAFSACDFRFKGIVGLPTFDLPLKADSAFTPRIVSRVAGERLGVLNTNDIYGEFVLDGRVANITSFGSPKFTPTHFKPFTIFNTSGSGIGHETFQGNQFDEAKPRCVRVFFTSYQTLDGSSGHVKTNFNDVKRKMNKCVVFRTR